MSGPRRTMTPEEEAAWVNAAQEGRLMEHLGYATFVPRVPRGPRRLFAENPIAVALRERYPCGEMPRGAMVQMAEEFGVTRQRVRQLAVKVGAEVARPAAKVRQCRNCGAPPNGSSPLCLDCSWPPQSCDECGTVFRRRASEVRGRTKQRRYADKAVFCSRRCFYKYNGHTPLMAGPRPQARKSQARHPESALQRARLSTTFSQQEIATLLGLADSSSVAMWERGGLAVPTKHHAKLDELVPGWRGSEWDPE